MDDGRRLLVEVGQAASHVVQYGAKDRARGVELPVTDGGDGGRAEASVNCEDSSFVKACSVRA